MNFFERLLTEGSGLSSKRFLSMIGMIVFIGVIVVSILGYKVPDLIVLSLVTIILGNGAMTLFQNKKTD